MHKTCSVTRGYRVFFEESTMSLFSLIRRRVTPLFLLCCFVFFGSQPSQAQVSSKTDPGTNNPPPAGALLDLTGSPIPGGGNGTYQHYTANFTAGIANTAITFAFRDDPAQIALANASVTDVTIPSAPSGNLLINGDFSGGTHTENGNNFVPNSWTYANVFGVFAGGGVVAGCGVGGVNCWLDGAVQGYDAISQTIATTIGHTYQISFDVAEDSATFATPGSHNGLFPPGYPGSDCYLAAHSGPSPCKFSELSTNGDTTDPAGNGINVTAYAQAGVPARGGTTSGAQLTINGSLNVNVPIPVFGTITDSQIHSDSFHTVTPGTGEGEDNCTAGDEISTDAYILQGGAPTGCDPGNGFEGSLGTGSTTVSGSGWEFGVTTKYVVLSSDSSPMCNSNGTICIGGGNPSNDTSFLTVTNNSGSSFTGTIGLAGTALKPGTCLPSGAASDSLTFGSDTPFLANTSRTFALSTDASACGGFHPTQTAAPQNVAVNVTNILQFVPPANNNLVQHNLTWPGTLLFSSSVPNPQLLSSNIILSTLDGIRPFLAFTPWAVGQLFEKAGDNQAAGGTGFGSLYRDKCFELNSDPSTATEPNCPIGASDNDFINFSDVFDQPGPKPDIAPGTTVSLVHHFTQTSASDVWAPVPSGANSNPVCTNVDKSGANFNCELEDSLTYDPARFAASPGGVSGDETTVGGKKKGRGTMGGVFKVPMLQTAVRVNTIPVNSIVPAEVQGTQQYWFNSHTLNLDFLVNPATTSAPVNGWFAAPPNTLAYALFSNSNSEPPLPDPPNCSSTTAPTCNVASGVPGKVPAAPVEFTSTQTVAADGMYTLAWSARDTVNIGERNIQLLHSLPSGSSCPNPYGLVPPPTPPCYSTTLFSAQIGVDTTFPNITITSPQATTYTINQTVPSSYACADPDGAADTPTCVGPVTSGVNIDTSVVGPHTFSVTSTDRAGNTTTKTVTYQVAYPNAFHLLFKLGSSKVSTGKNQIYVIILVNFGPGAAYGVTLRDAVPAGTNFVSAAVFEGANCPMRSGTVTCSIGTLPPFSAVSVKLVVNVTASAGSKISNTAMVTGLNPDPHTGNTTSNTVVTKVTP
jgi:uncharacterized repeat protein (TIGR01451 family)